MKRTIKLFAALVGMLLISFAVVVPALASAEQCSPDGKICLVTDVSQPLVTPTTLQFRVTSEANAFGAFRPSAMDGHLVEQGAPGGMSLWEISLLPVPTDATIDLETNATGLDTEASFSVSVLATAANLTTTIRRQGKWFVARTSYDGRGPVTADIVFAIESIKHLKSGGEPVGVFKKRRRVEATLPGHQEFIQKIPVNAVKQTCRKRTQCQLSSFANLSVATPDPSDGKDIYSAHAFRKRKGPLIG